MHTPLSVIKSSWLSHFLSHNRRFGCDFRFMKDKTNGILDCAVNLQPFWQDTPLLDKADRLVYRQTKMTHAMVTHFLVKTKSLSFWLSAANFPLFCFCPLYWAWTIVKVSSFSLVSISIMEGPATGEWKTAKGRSQVQMGSIWWRKTGLMNMCFKFVFFSTLNVASLHDLVVFCVIGGASATYDLSFSSFHSTIANLESLLSQFNTFRSSFIANSFLHKLQMLPIRRRLKVNYLRGILSEL